MPKSKPTQIIVHRIEAGTWEREQLLRPVADVAQTANQIRSYGIAAIPVVLAGGVYVAWKVGKSAYGWLDTLKDDIDGFRNSMAPVQQNIPAIIDPEQTPTMGFAESVILTFVNLFGLGK
jgi:hypothetical protein